MRKPVQHHRGDPSFLFSTWPIPYLAADGIPTVLITPEPGRDMERMWAATNRLKAVGGGTMLLTEGLFTLSEPADFT